MKLKDLLITTFATLVLIPAVGNTAYASTPSSLWHKGVPSWSKGTWENINHDYIDYGFSNKYVNYVFWDVYPYTSPHYRKTGKYNYIFKIRIDSSGGFYGKMHKSFYFRVIHINSKHYNNSMLISGIYSYKYFVNHPNMKLGEYYKTSSKLIKAS